MDHDRRESEEIARAIDEKALEVVRIAEQDQNPYVWVPILRRAASLLEQRYSPSRATVRSHARESGVRVFLPGDRGNRDAAG